jgi:hypothetical protein
LIADVERPVERQASALVKGGFKVVEEAEEVVIDGFMRALVVIVEAEDAENPIIKLMCVE